MADYQSFLKNLFPKFTNFWIYLATFGLKTPLNSRAVASPSFHFLINLFI